MQSFGYETGPGHEGNSEHTGDGSALSKARQRYEQMQAGVFRQKLRRRGALVLNSYKHFGLAIALFPKRRVASSSKDWLEKAASDPDHDEYSVLSTGRTLDEEILGVKDAFEESKHLTERERFDAASDSSRFRERIGQISQHSAVFFAGTMFTGLAGYLFKVYVARMIGAEALGIYALGMTIIAFLGVFSGLGLTQAAVRFVPLYTATGRSRQLRGFLLRAMLWLLGANAALALAVVTVGPWLGEHVYHTSELKRYLPLFALIMVLGALTTYGGQILQGYKDVARRTVITNFIGTPVVMILTVGFLLLGWGLWGYIFAQVVSAVVVLGLLMLAVWKLTPLEVFQEKGPWAPLGSEVVAFGFAAFGISAMEFLLAQTDKILIGFYLNPKEVGIYALAMAVVAFVPIALQSVNQIFSPTIADLHSRGENELLERLFQTLTKWIFGFTVPLAIAVMVFAEPLMRVFGADFASGWPVLVIGTAGQLANCGTGSVGYLLMMSGNQNRLVKVQATMTALLVLLNVLFIPRWGIMGAVVVAALTNIGTNIWNLLEVRSSLGFSPFNRSYWQLLPAGIVTLSAELVLKRLGHVFEPGLVFIMVSVAVGYLIFSGILVATGLDADDRLIAGTTWSKVRESLQRAR